ncbi:hypothetical protein [Massilia horti]
MQLGSQVQDFGDVGVEGGGWCQRPL